MNKLKAVLGVTNKTKDNKYIPFLDFDEIDYPNLILTIYKIQNKYQLDNAYIIESTHGYNVFFLDKTIFEKCIEICKYSECDTNFIIYAETKKNFTLRVGRDKKFIKTINSCYGAYELSYAHYMFFTEFFHVDILNGVEITEMHFDKYDELELVMYMSKKYGYIEVD